MIFLGYGRSTNIFGTMTKVNRTSRSEVLEKEVHECLKSRIHTGNPDNKEVAQQSDCVDDQEQNKEGNLHVKVLSKTEKNKLSDSGMIFTTHILD